MDKKRKEFIIGLIAILIVIAVAILISSVYRKEIAGKVVSEEGLIEGASESTQFISEDGHVISSMIQFEGNKKEELPRYVPGEIIVKFKSDPEINKADKDVETKYDSINNLNEKYNIKSFEKVFEKQLKEKIDKNIELSEKENELARVVKLKTDSKEDINKIVEDYKKDSNVEYAEPNYLAYTSYVPNDPLYSQQWAHQKTQAELGWDIEQGNENIVIAIVDTGVDYNHEDLKNNPSCYININVTSSKSGYVSQQYSTKSFSSLGTNKQGLMWYGTTGKFRTSSAVHYEYFDLSSIPSGAIITSAKLYKYHDTANIGTDTNNLMSPKSLKTTNRVTLGKLTENFLETDSYKSVGNRYRNQIILPKIDKSVKNSTVTDLILEYDVKDVVQYWVYGKPNYGFSFLGNYNSAGYGAANYYFRNAGVNSPKLVVEYEIDDCDSGLISGAGYDFVDIDTQLYIDSGFEFIPEEDYTIPDNNPSDYSGHGTHVAGIAAAVDNDKGVVGICPKCKIMPARAGFAIKYGGYTYGILENDDIANAIYYATDNGAKIISMSFGGDESQLQKDAIDYAYSRGVVLIAAAGNSYDDNLNYPAAFYNVIAIAATNQNDLKPDFSTYGYWVDVAAPGVDILSTVPKTGAISDSSGYKAISGTSMATPYVSGLAGLILSKHPEFTNEQVRKVLRQGVDTPNEQNYYIGTGRVNVNKALQVDTLPSAVAEISYPKNDELIFKNIEIIGTATGDSYKVYYGEGIYPTNWVEIGSGTQVINGVLANFDISEVLWWRSTFKLIVEDINGRIEDRATIYTGKGYQEGWPVQTRDGLSNFFPPIIDDLDNNGEKEIIIGGGFGREDYFPYGSLHIFNYNGDYFKDFPLFADFYEEWTGIPEQPGSIGDINGDGEKEIVLGTSRFWWDNNKNHAGLFVFDLDKNLLWFKKFENGNDNYYSCNSLGDINNDDKLDIIIQSSPSNKIRALDGEGNILWIKEVNGITSGYRNGCFDIGDINGDNNNEILFFVYSGRSNSLINLTLYVLDSEGNEIFSYLWHTEVDENHDSINLLTSNYILADIDNDQNPELIFDLTEIKWGTPPIRSSILYYLDFDGHFIIKTIKELDVFESGIGVGDINNDNNLEIILIGTSYDASACGSAHRRKLLAIDYGGNILFEKPIESSGAGLPTIADITGDGYADIIFSSACFSKKDWLLYAFTHNGDEIDGFPKRMVYFSNYFNPAVDDLDNDGDIEIVIHDTTSRIYVWDLDAPYNEETMEWPMFQHDPQHTGCYDCEEPITENICSLSVSGIPVDGFNVCASKSYNCFIEEEKSTCEKNCIVYCGAGSIFCTTNCNAPTNPGTWCNTPPGLGKIPECAPWCNVYPKEIVCQSDILAGNAGPIPTKINIASQNNFYISRSVDSASFPNTPVGKISISGNGCNNKEVSVSSGVSVSSNVAC